MTLTLGRYRAIAINEPHGEGNGWEECAPDAATCWAVEDAEPFDFWLTDGTFDTRAQAEAEVARLEALERDQ